LKFDAVLIRDSEGDRRLDASDLPLRLGTGVDCEIRLPGPGSNAVALLDDLDGAPFVQPIGASGALQINGEPLRTSRKLVAGDELEFYGTRVLVSTAGTALLLEIHLEGSAYVTKPPDLPGSQSGPAEEAIVATAFRRSVEARQADTQTTRFHWQGIVGGIVGVLVLLSWLLFTSKSIQFDVQPAGLDELSISGGWFKMPVGERFLMREGTYTVHVKKEGYYDVAQSVRVDATPGRTVVIEMRKLPGLLTIVTDPPVEAIVTVDDNRVGTAPYGPLEVEPGTHTVTVQADRFLPYTERLTVPGLGLHQQLEVQLVPVWADVEISSNPSGAAVYQDTVQIGETPLSLELMEGSHSLSLIKEGFKAWDFSVETVANEDQVLATIQLEPANAQLRVSSIPRGANVTVNGRYRGQSPVDIFLSPDINYQIGLSRLATEPPLSGCGWKRPRPRKLRST